MSDPHILGTPLEQTELEIGSKSQERSLLDELLSKSKLYKSSADFQALLDFTVRLRNMAPFNAMLLQIQKPGLNYAASEKDWKTRFNRATTENARPLLIMWPFAPVALVYDVLDTEGDPIPKNAFAFYATGKIDKHRMNRFNELLDAKSISVELVDQGDRSAGLIRRENHATDKKKFSKYAVQMNQNHDAPMRFVTLAHELAHLFLGHLGDDPKLRVRGRRPDYRVREIEAESVAYIVCKRNEVDPESQSYLSNFVKNDEDSEQLDIYSITRAAGHIEQILHLSTGMKWRD